MPAALALLNLGGEEIFLVLVLFLLLFGAKKVPEIARQLGRARAEMERARDEVVSAMRSEEEKQLDEQLAFERAREHQMAQQQDPESVRLRAAAAELGIATDGLSDDDIKKAIATRIGNTDETKTNEG